MDDGEKHACIDDIGRAVIFIQDSCHDRYDKLLRNIYKLEQSIKNIEDRNSKKDLSISLTFVFVFVFVIYFAFRFHAVTGVAL